MVVWQVSVLEAIESDSREKIRLLQAEVYPSLYESLLKPWMYACELVAHSIGSFGDFMSQVGRAEPRTDRLLE